MPGSTEQVSWDHPVPSGNQMQLSCLLCRSKLICSAAWTPKRMPAPWLSTSQLSSYPVQWVSFLCKASCWLFKQLEALGCILPGIPIAVLWLGIESWALTKSLVLVSWTSLDKRLTHFECFADRKRGLPWRSLMFESSCSPWESPSSLDIEPSANRSVVPTLLVVWAELENASPFLTVWNPKLFYDLFFLFIWALLRDLVGNWLVSFFIYMLDPRECV